MGNTKTDIITEVEGLILESGLLNFEDKKKLLVDITTFTPEQLTRMKELLVYEQAEMTYIKQLEQAAWQKFYTNIKAIA